MRNKKIFTPSKKGAHSLEKERDESQLIMTSHTTVAGDNSYTENIQQEPAGEGDLFYPLGAEEIHRKVTFPYELVTLLWMNKRKGNREK